MVFYFWTICHEYTALYYSYFFLILIAVILAFHMMIFFAAIQSSEGVRYGPERVYSIHIHARSKVWK